MKKMWKSGMVLAGRGARACDMCGKERARWYCAADEAYLCERCDGAVHSANLLARRHERMKLGPNGAPTNANRKWNEQSREEGDEILASRKRHSGSRKRSKNSRASSQSGAFHPPAVPITALADDTEACVLVNAKQEFAVATLISKEEERTLQPTTDAHEEIIELPTNTFVKSEPASPRIDYRSTTTSDFFDFNMSEVSELAHEVPTYEPFLRELIAASHGDLMEEIVPTSSSLCNNDWGDGGCKLEALPDSSNTACEVEVSVVEDGSISINDVSETDEFDVMDLCEEGKQEEEISEELSDIEMWRRIDSDACSTFGGNPFKGKGERQLEMGSNLQKVESEEQAVPWVNSEWSYQQAPALSSAFSRTLLLQLNYEDVLMAWSDRGSFWMDGHRPQIVPDDSFLDHGNLDYGLHAESSCNSSQAEEQAGQVPVVEMSNEAGLAREARVMRYREKRRTRFFSKKIRYEVRKLNAERRPRMKGRFVKLSTITV